MNKMYMNESQPTYVTGTKSLNMVWYICSTFPILQSRNTTTWSNIGFSSPGVERSLFRTQTYQHLLDFKICSPFLYASKEFKLN